MSAVLLRYRRRHFTAAAATGAATGAATKGPPSLLKCKKLTVEGKVIFSTGVVIVGDVKVVAKDAVGIVKPGTYTDTTVEV